MSTRVRRKWNARGERKRAIQEAIDRAKALGYTGLEIAEACKWKPAVLSSFMKTGYASDERLDSIEKWLESKRLFAAEDPATYKAHPSSEETDDEIMEGLAEKLRALADYISSPADLCSRLRAYTTHIKSFYNGLDKLRMASDENLEKSEG